jgi:hypothetical protein
MDRRGWELRGYKDAWAEKPCKDARGFEHGTDFDAYLKGYGEGEARRQATRLPIVDITSWMDE